MLTISRLSRWSINYYNDTARQAGQAGLDRQRANGGLGEYYSEGETRAPTWLIVNNGLTDAEDYRHHWYSYEELKSVFRELAMAAHRDTGEYKIPG